MKRIKILTNEKLKSTFDLLVNKSEELDPEFRPFYLMGDTVKVEYKDGKTKETFWIFLIGFFKSEENDKRIVGMAYDDSKGFLGHKQGDIIILDESCIKYNASFVSKLNKTIDGYFEIVEEYSYN
jgi:hypothetical protein